MGITKKERKTVLLVDKFDIEEEDIEDTIKKFETNSEYLLVKAHPWKEIYEITISDYDVVLLNFHKPTRIGRGLSNADFENLSNMFEKQLSKNGIVIIFANSSQFSLPHYSNLKGDRNDHWVSEDAIHLLFPFIPKDCEQGKGSNINFSDISSSHQFLIETGLSNFKWVWSIKENREQFTTKYKVLARNKQNDIVSIIFNKQPGLVIVLPQVINKNEIIEHYLHNIDQFGDISRKGNLITIKKPSWMDDFDKLGRRNLKTKLNEIKNKIEVIETVEKLLYTYDTSLEQAVHYIFDFLGFQRIPSITNRSDIIYTYKEIRLVVEVKGLKKQAKETSLQQLFRWKSDELKKKEIGEIPDEQKIKYIFVCNSEREIDPLKRRQPFEKNAIKQAENNEWGLLSTFELFKAYVDLQNKKIQKEDLINAITSGIGEVKLTKEKNENI